MNTAETKAIMPVFEGFATIQNGWKPGMFGLRHDSDIMYANPDVQQAWRYFQGGAICQFFRQPMQRVEVQP